MEEAASLLLLAKNLDMVDVWKTLARCKQTHKGEVSILLAAAINTSHFTDALLDLLTLKKAESP